MPCFYCEIWRKRSPAVDGRLTERCCCLVNVRLPEQTSKGKIAARPRVRTWRRKRKASASNGRRGVFDCARDGGAYLEFYVQSLWFPASFRCDSRWSAENRGAFCAAPWSLFTALRVGHGRVATLSHVWCIRAWLVEMEGVFMSCKYGAFWSQPWWTAALFLDIYST